MKKTISLLLALILVMACALSASASVAQSSYVFCYVIDITGDKFEVMTDDEVPLIFTRGASMSIMPQGASMKIDDAVVVQYIGTIQTETEQQSVQVAEVTVLTTLYGTVEDAANATISVRVMGDDGSDGPLYLFDRENADIYVGEAGILIGDEVEVAFRGTKAELVPDQLQTVGYTHITVYGQVEDTME